jgi:hypothetical protein
MVHLLRGQAAKERSKNTGGGILRHLAGLGVFSSVGAKAG